MSEPLPGERVNMSTVCNIRRGCRCHVCTRETQDMPRFYILNHVRTWQPGDEAWLAP